IQFTVADASTQRVSDTTSHEVHSLVPVHDPLSDNYAHCELGLFRGDSPPARLEQQDAKKGEAKRAKREFRAWLADRARVRLHANEGATFIPNLQLRAATRHVQLRTTADAGSPRCGILRSRTIVVVLEKLSGWIRVRAVSGKEGWTRRRRLRRV